MNEPMQLLVSCAVCQQSPEAGTSAPAGPPSPFTWRNVSSRGSCASVVSPSWRCNSPTTSVTLPGSLPTFGRLSILLERLTVLTQALPPLGHPGRVFPVPFGLELLALPFEPGPEPGGPAAAGRTARFAVRSRSATTRVDDLRATSRATLSHRGHSGDQELDIVSGVRLPTFSWCSSRITSAGCDGLCGRVAPLPPVPLAVASDAHGLEVVELELGTTYVERDLVVDLQLVCRAAVDAAVAVALSGKCSSLLPSCAVPCASCSLLSRELAIVLPATVTASAADSGAGFIVAAA